MSMRAFFQLHDGLAREAPGDDAATREALCRLRLPWSPHSVLDLGCGPGRATLVLARERLCPIVSVDLHAPFLDRLARDAAAAGLDRLVTPRCADFGALAVAPRSVDLIWSEGAIYHLGFAAGLRIWSPLLSTRGRLAITELTWRVPPDERPAEIAEYWRAAYPAMTSVEDNLTAARAAKYKVVDHFPLPRRAWSNYYDPLIARADALAPTADPELAAVISEARLEADMYRRYGHTYDYVFYLLRALRPPAPT